MKCSKCGKSIENDWKCCPNCGSINFGDVNSEFSNCNKSVRDNSKDNKEKVYIIELFVGILLLIMPFNFILPSTVTFFIKFAGFLIYIMSLICGYIRYKDSNFFKTVEFISIALFIVIGVVLIWKFWSGVVDFVNEFLDSLRGCA